MTITKAPLALLGLCLAAQVRPQNRRTDRAANLLPGGAQIIESANVPVGSAKTRVLVLWMKSPQKVMSTWDSAADFVYGNHWFGPAFLTLLDPANARLINTINIRPSAEAADVNGDLEIPFYTSVSFYEVPHPDKQGRGLPTLLRLRDMTGEGVAGQFVLFEHVASGIAAGSVLGYSARSDAAMQYTVETTTDSFLPFTERWAIGVFDTKPTKAGSWKYTWEAGHGEQDWIDEDVRFDSARQLFTEKKTVRPYPGFARFYCHLDSASLSNFLERLRTAASPEIDIEWLRGLIARTPPNTIAAAGLLPAFQFTRQWLTMAIQSSATGEIRTEFTTDSPFAAHLQSELRTWCEAN